MDSTVFLSIENTSALYVCGNLTYSLRAKHIALRHLVIQELVEHGTIAIHYARTQDQLADIGIKHLITQRHQNRIDDIRDFGA